MAVQPEVARDPAASRHANTAMNINNSMSGLLKCYCNDDVQCPRQQTTLQADKALGFESSSSSSALSSIGLSADQVRQSPKLAAFLERIGDTTPRYCQTSTMCLTKRLQKNSGETWLKYGCDHSQPDSIKNSVLQFRDCRVNTDNPQDRATVLNTASEFCCSDGDFCNVDLEPVQSSRDMLDFATHFNSPTDNTSSTSANWKHINLVIGCLSFVVFILVVVLFVLYLYKKVFQISIYLSRTDRI